MPKTSVTLRLPPTTLEAGRAAARFLNLSFSEYVERLIVEDATGARAVGMAAAQRMIATYGQYLDEIEEGRSAGTPRPGVTTTTPAPTGTPPTAA
jgi:hypothetical protein